MPLPQGLPQRTLGWDILDWASTYLAHPDGDNRGGNWVYTNEQAKFLLWFYALDEQGRFNYRRALLGRIKGWGKSPFVASIACAELLGPVKFDGWNAAGGAVGRPQPSPIIQIFAISTDQVENSYEPLMVMLSEGEASRQYRIDVMRTKVIAHGRGQIEKVTASPRSREGRQTTFAIADETHLWVPAENGPELAAVMRRNLAKKDARSIETTNAPVPGQMSVAEGSYEAAERGIDGLLFDSLESDCDDIYDEKQFKGAVTRAAGDAYWIPVERYWQEVQDPVNTEPDMRRFYLNQRTKAVTQWIKDKTWKECEQPVKKLKKTDKIALGFKGAHRNGAAVLVACRLTDMSLHIVGMWERPMDAAADWEVPSYEVDQKVRSVLENYDVYYLVAEPAGWQDVIGKWAAEHEEIEIKELWQTQNSLFCKAVEQFESAVHDKRVSYPPNADLTRHILNTHYYDVPQGKQIRKQTEKSHQYISGAIASVMAVEAAIKAIEDGALNEVDNTLYSW